MAIKFDILLSRVVNAPAPIIFLDTCSILDIIRCGFRENIDSQEIMASRRLISVRDGLWLVTCQTVEMEWLDNNGILADFTAVDARYVSSLSWAVHHVGI